MRRSRVWLHRLPHVSLGCALLALLIAGWVSTSPLAAKAQDDATEESADTLKLSRPPTVRAGKQPDYPDQLRAKGVTGKATVGFVVTKQGDVVNAYVVEATQPEFGVAAVQAIKSWKFEPGIKDGEPSPCLLQQSFDFALK